MPRACRSTPARWRCFARACAPPPPTIAHRRPGVYGTTRGARRAREAPWGPLPPCTTTVSLSLLSSILERRAGLVLLSPTVGASWPSSRILRDESGHRDGPIRIPTTVYLAIIPMACFLLALACAVLLQPAFTTISPLDIPLPSCPCLPARIIGVAPFLPL